MLGIGAFLLFMVPVGCAIFPQICEMPTAHLKETEPEAYAEAVKKFGSEDKLPEKLYFNKGL